MKPYHEMTIDELEESDYLRDPKAAAISRIVILVLCAAVWYGIIALFS